MEARPVLAGPSVHPTLSIQQSLYWHEHSGIGS